MRKNVILVSIAMLLIVSAAPVYSEETEDISDVLHSYYQASVEEDVEIYMGTLDSAFFDDMMPEDQSYEDFVAGTFSVIDTLYYDIEDLSIKVMPDSALAFFTIKATIKQEENRKDVDNDMVAFLWKYGSDWKIRWVMTEKLYDLKLNSDVVNDMAVYLTIKDASEESLKDLASSLGVIEPEDESIMENEDDAADYNDGGGRNGFDQKEYQEYYDKHYGDANDEENGSQIWKWLLFAAVVAGMLVLIFKGRKSKKSSKNKKRRKNRDYRRDDHLSHSRARKDQSNKDNPSDDAEAEEREDDGSADDIDDEQDGSDDDDD